MFHTLFDQYKHFRKLIELIIVITIINNIETDPKKLTTGHATITLYPKTVPKNQAINPNAQDRKST